MASTGKPSTMAHTALLIVLVVLAVAVAGAAEAEVEVEAEVEKKNEVEVEAEVEKKNEVEVEVEVEVEKKKERKGAKEPETTTCDCELTAYIAVCEQAASQDSHDAKLDGVCCKAISAAGLPCRCSLRRRLVKHGYVDNKDGRTMQAISCVPDAASCY